MESALYDQLVPWYRLLDPIEDHREEAAAFGEALRAAIDGEARTLLELGTGGGNNAHFLKQHFQCTLTDLSEPMLRLSREINPECEHMLGDMRTLRLGKLFDAVLVHDAVGYMLTQDDLRAALQTAFVHTRPGGVALVAPDCLRETFTEYSNLHEGHDGVRSLRCMQWAWDPDPGDTTYRVEWAFLLRDGDQMQAIHDRHTEGLFARRTWVDLLREVGFEVGTCPRPLVDQVEAAGLYWGESFLCRRPRGERR